MTEEALELLLHRDATLTEARLKDYYEEDEDIKILLDSERYSLFAGGKRVRPVLALEFCKLFGGREEAALPFACGLEMIHTASLIHDDLPCMDNDDLRRGKPTNHKVFGETMALLAGDSLLIGAFEAVASNPEVTPEIAARAAAYLASCTGRYGMVGGQVMDLQGEHRKLTLDELLKLHSMKTGALINASCVLGALAAGVSPDSKAMQDTVTYAEKIGLAFQILDDLLDKIGNVEELGKNVGMDEAREKNTFLSFFSPDEAKEYIDRLTEEALVAIRPYPGSDALCSFTLWLSKRTK